jgi:hypothetical protein
MLFEKELIVYSRGTPTVDEKESGSPSLNKGAYTNDFIIN